MYRLTVADKETYWIVQRNILPARLPVHVKYDLKGSTIDRSASTKERVSLRGSRKEVYRGVAPSFAHFIYICMHLTALSVFDVHMYMCVSVMSCVIAMSYICTSVSTISYCCQRPVTLTYVSVSWSLQLTLSCFTHVCM